MILVFKNGKYTLAFFMLREIIGQPVFQNKICNSLVDGYAYKKLIDNQYIQRVKTINYKTKREVYFCYITKKGYKVYEELDKKLIDETKKDLEEK